MANPYQESAAAAAGEQWDEARMEAALQNLKDLHIKLRELRSTIPKMHERMSTSKVGEATQAASNEIDDYKKLATSPENTKILERAKQSRKDHPKGIKPWRPRDETDWLTPST